MHRFPRIRRLEEIMSRNKDIFLELNDADSMNIIANLKGIDRYCECEHPHAYVEKAEIIKPRIVMEINGRTRPLFCRVIWRCFKCGGIIYNPKALLNGGDPRNTVSNQVIQ